VLSVAKDPQSQPVDFFSSILEKFKNNQKRNNSLSLKIRFPWLDIFVLSSVSLTSFECVFVCVFIWTWPINFFISIFRPTQPKRLKICMDWCCRCSSNRQQGSHQLLQRVT
jgi:hypothetical protein